MELVSCTPADVPQRMREIQWQAMWRYYVLPGMRRKAGEQSFVASAERFDLDCCLIAVDDGMDAGFCWTQIHGDEAWCGGIGVRPEFRRRGIGKALLNGVAERLRDRGVTRWWLEVVQKNEAAVQSYLSVGFHLTHDLGLYRGRVDAEPAAGERVADADAAECLALYDGEWTPVDRPWGTRRWQLAQRTDSLSARRLERDGRTVAFMLYSGGGISDIGLAPGVDGTAALPLIGSLESFSWGNVPDSDPARAAIDPLFSVECWTKQWEMAWEI